MKLHPLLNSSIAYIPEDEDAALGRYKGFAETFFRDLYQAMPQLRGKFAFYRDPDTDDLWSVCKGVPISFGVQLDPDCKVICLWDSEYNEEIGCWPPQLPNPVKYAIETIRERYLPCA